MYAEQMITVYEPGVHRLTVDEFERVVPFLRHDRVELVDGVIYDVSPESHGHSKAVADVFLQLHARHPDQQVLPGSGVHVDEVSLWAPDVYLLDALPDAEFEKYPMASDLLLAVEISVSTFRHDIRVKAPVYARNGIPEYWVLRPVLGRAWELLRHTQPEGDGYQVVDTIALPDGPGSLPI